MTYFEDQIQNIVSKVGISENGNNFNAVFDYGNENDLNKFLTLYKEKAYPLFFLVNNTDIYSVENKLKEVIRNNARIIIAIQKPETIDLLTKDWYASAFKNVLSPLANTFAIELDKTKNATTSSTYRVDKYANYSQNGEDNATIDVCNVIVLEYDFIKFKIC